MATTEGACSLSLLAGAAFVAADLGKLVTISGANTVSIVSGLTDTVAGVLGQSPAAQGEEIAVLELRGRIKVRAGGSVSAGQIAVPAANGKITGVASIDALGANVMGIGIILESGVDEQIVEVLAMPLTSAASA